MLVTVFRTVGVTGIMGCGAVDESERTCGVSSAVGMDEED